MSSRPLRLNRIWAPSTPLLILCDGLLVYMSGLVWLWLLTRASQRSADWPIPELWNDLLIAAACLFPLLMQSAGAYRPRPVDSFQRDVTRRLSAWGLLILLGAALLFITKTGASFSRAWIGGWCVLTGIGIVMQCLLIHVLRQQRRKRGIGVKPILIVGSGTLAASVANALVNHVGAGLRPVGYLSENDSNHMPASIPCLGRLNDIEQAVAQADVAEVWVTLPLTEQPRIQKVLRKMRQNLVDVRLVPDIFAYDLLNRQVDEVLGFPLIGLTTTPHHGLDHHIKRAIDLVGALIALILFSPVMLICHVSVLTTSPGGAYFRQMRHGLNGRPFEMLKFRTMYVRKPDAAFRQASRDDPRLTRVGRWMRRHSLDELPQIWNVLRGEMSLVGPRPHAVSMNLSFWDDIDRYALRHRVKPGITGWAQVHGLRGETHDVDLLRKRIEYDLFYIENWSLPLDIRILARTLLVAWSQDNAY